MPRPSRCFSSRALRVGDAGKVDHPALVHRAETDAVAVALKQFQQAMDQRPLETVSGAQDRW